MLNEILEFRKKWNQLQIKNEMKIFHYCDNIRK